MPSRKPLVLQSGLPKQLATGDVLDIPARTVPVYLSGGGARAVKIASVGTALVLTAAGASLVIAHNSTGGVWEIGKDTDAAALSARVGAAEANISDMQTSIGGKLDANFSTLADGVAPALTDLMVLRRGAISAKLTVQGWIDWLLNTARTWTGVQTFSAGAVLGEQSPTIKCKVIDTTLPSSTGVSADLAPHGLAAANIISVIGYALDTNGSNVPPNTYYANSQWACNWSSTHIRAALPSATTSSAVSGRSVRFHIFYKA